MSLLSSRRGFLQGASILGAGSVMGMTNVKSIMAAPASKGKSVLGLKCAPLEKVKVGVIGLGMRGPGAVFRLAAIPGVEIVALCDLFENRVSKQVEALVKKGKPAPKTYFGSPDAWKKLAEDKDVNLVYICTPWAEHTPMALYAMDCGKHVACEVPICFTIEESWALVNKAEETQRHCMLLENCCYGESEMLALNMARREIFGQLVHGEGAYIHDLRGLQFSENGYQGMWRLKWNTAHTGNPYPTHGLGPICQYMNINRGDKMDVLTAMTSGGFGFPEYVKARPNIKPEFRGPWKQGDMCTALIKTSKGRTIMVQHDTTSPRPYSRINLISGTKGILKDYPLEIALESQGGGHGWLKGEARQKVIEEHRHPLWKSSGELAKQMGGHGGMDFLMDLRLCYCLQNGLPLDIDVYDSVLWSCLAELTEWSTLNNGAPVVVPDFTRGGWQNAEPLGIVDVDIEKIDAKKALEGKSAAGILEV